MATEPKPASSIPATRTARLVSWLEARINLTEVFSLLSIFGVFYAEVDTKKPISQAIREALAKPMPSYARWPRVLGLVVLILFLVEVLTGGLLAFYYRPAHPDAYQTVLEISRDVSYGWFVRQMHFWGAQLLVITLIVRMLRFYLAGLYRAPRELIWIAGALLFVTATHLDLTGRILSWSNEAYWSGVRALDLLYSIPLVGDGFSFLIGGIEMEAYSLVRFYFLHIAVLPFIFWCILYFSFSGIRRVGLSEIDGESRQEAGPSYRAHLLNLSILFLLIFAVLVSLAVLWPMPLGKPADPSTTDLGGTLPWYLLAPYGLVEFLPHWLPLGLRSSLVLFLLLVFVFFPFLDRGSSRKQSQRRWAILLGIVVFLFWLGFSYYGLVFDLGEI